MAIVNNVSIPFNVQNAPAEPPYPPFDPVVTLSKATYSPGDLVSGTIAGLGQSYPNLKIRFSVSTKAQITSSADVIFQTDVPAPQYGGGFTLKVFDPGQYWLNIFWTY